MVYFGKWFISENGLFRKMTQFMKFLKKEKILEQFFVNE